MAQSHQSDNNGLAVASLVLGILSVTGFSIFTGIPAIITGMIGLKSTANKGMCLAGIIMGSISVVFALLIIAVIIVFILAGAFSATPSTMPAHPNYYDQPSTSVQQRI